MNFKIIFKVQIYFIQPLLLLYKNLTYIMHTYCEKEHCLFNILTNEYK